MGTRKNGAERAAGADVPELSVLGDVAGDIEMFVG